MAQCHLWAARNELPDLALDVLRMVGIALATGYCLRQPNGHRDAFSNVENLDGGPRSPNRLSYRTIDLTIVLLGYGAPPTLHCFRRSRRIKVSVTFRPGPWFR